MACDEAELEVHEFSQKILSHQKLQERVIMLSDDELIYYISVLIFLD